MNRKAVIIVIGLLLLTIFAVFVVGTTAVTVVEKSTIVLKPGDEVPGKSWFASETWYYSGSPVFYRGIFTKQTYGHDLPIYVYVGNYITMYGKPYYVYEVTQDGTITLWYTP